MTREYVLDKNGEPVLCKDLMSWAKFMSSVDRYSIQDLKDGVGVSTVFLGLDHNFKGYGPPILYETMIFGGRFDQKQWRYATRAEAMEGHANAVALAHGAVPLPEEQEWKG
jgi:hypothetical protein